MTEKGIKDFENCINADDIFVKASQLYNQLLSREDKMWLEETEVQKDISIEINQRLRVLNLETLFKNW
jgi:hypothetical protein